MIIRQVTITLKTEVRIYIIIMIQYNTVNLYNYNNNKIFIFICYYCYMPTLSKVTELFYYLLPSVTICYINIHLKL